MRVKVVDIMFFGVNLFFYIVSVGKGNIEINDFDWEFSLGVDVVYVGYDNFVDVFYLFIKYV